MKRLFTSESVTEGHPDKISDAISDAVLDAYLAQDRSARVACETFCTTDTVVIMGEITSTATVDIESIARKVICEIGYDDKQKYFDGNTCSVQIMVHEQSPDIAMGVDRSLEVKEGEETQENQNGAGDQGMMFGYACNETDTFMPMSIYYAHKLAKRLTDVRKNGTLPYLRADGKTQVTVEYENDKPVRIDTVVISSQHSADVSMETIRDDIKREVIDPTIPSGLLDENTKYYINPTGRFVIGGPAGDTGLTGRKIIVDTYGGVGRHGGGAFSGKDPTKVDRSAAYAARYVAKNIVAANIAQKCEVQLAYAIGVAKPVSILVDTFGTGVVAEDMIEQAVVQLFDLRPSAIIEQFGLRDLSFRPYSSYGHIGREDLDCPWEKTDKANALSAILL